MPPFSLCSSKFVLEKALILLKHKYASMGTILKLLSVIFTLVNEDAGSGRFWGRRVEMHEDN